MATVTTLRREDIESLVRLALQRYYPNSQLDGPFYGSIILNIQIDDSKPKAIQVNNRKFRPQDLLDT